METYLNSCRKQFILTLSLLCVGILSFSQTVIKGQSQSFDGKLIYIASIADQLSQGRETLASEFIADSLFKFELDIENVQEVELRCGSWLSRMFLEPGETYHISFELDDTQPQRLTDNLAKIDFTEKPNSSLNADLSDYMLKMNEFLQEVSLAMTFNSGSDSYKEQNREKLVGLNLLKSERDSIKTNERVNIDGLLEKFTKENKPSKSSHPFLKDYMTYTNASFDLLIFEKTELFEKYLLNSTHPFNNPGYAMFVKENYKYCLGELSDTDQRNEFLTRLASPKATSLVVDFFKVSDDLPEDVISRIVLFQIKMAAETKLIPVKHAISFFERGVSSGDANGKACQTYLKSLKKMGAGVKISDFELLAPNHDRVSTASFEGEIVYYSFFSPESKSCLRECLTMERLHDKYGKKISFVSICTDTDYKVFEQYLLDHPNQDWTFLYGGQCTEMMKEFNVKSIPSFYLVDNRGYMMQDFTPSPSTGIDRVFDQITSSNGQGQKLKVWDD